MRARSFEPFTSTAGWHPRSGSLTVLDDGRGIVSPSVPRRALVLGAGITGLAAARRARRDGWKVTVWEASGRVGGTFRTQERDGFRFELGPNTVHQSPALDAVVADAGASDGWRHAAMESKRRYLVRGGRLVALPSAPPGIVTTGALSPLARLRLLAEPLRRVGPGVDEPMATFVRRRLGRGAGALADAMVLGVYAGDPEELSVGRAFPRMFSLEQEHGSLLRGLRAQQKTRPALVGFEGGFEGLTRRLVSNLDVQTLTRARGITCEAGVFCVHGRQGEADIVHEADRLIVALPARAAADLLATVAGTEMLAPVANLPHAPVAVVGLGFRADQIGHPLDGFGLLAPHRERRRVLGALFVSTLFPECAPAGHVAITAMIGGRRRPGLVDLDDDTLRAVATEALRDLLQIEGSAVTHVVARWQPGIPQPTPASAAAWATADTIEARHPGMEILGNWRHGVGVPDCARAGWGEADT